MKRKNLCLWIFGLVLSLGLTACGENPDTSIVKNKDFDKMLNEAGKKDEGDHQVNDIAPDYDTYKNSFHDDKLGVSVDVDADVDLPKADQMSVLRVRKKDISQKFIDTFLDHYGKDVKLYDGSVTDIRTKSDVEQDISAVKEAMKSCTEDERIEYQAELEALQEEYVVSPEKINWDDYVSDRKMHPTDDLLEKHNNSVYQWMKECSPKSHVFYAANDGRDGEYLSIYAQNNDNYSNCFRYRKNKHGFEFTAAQAVINTPLQNVDYGQDAGTIWRAGEDIPENLLGGASFAEFQDEKATLAEEDAKKKAQELMDRMGLDDFALYDCGLYCELPDIRKLPDKDKGYRTVYIIRFMRCVDGVMVAGEGEKYTDEFTGSGYEKKEWPPEAVEIRVNDNGVVGFDYNSPIEIVEKVVEQSKMEKFEDIKKIFEKMSVITHANDNAGGGTLYTNMKVDRVTLGYVMISEEDNFDTGLLVPGWDFFGLTEHGFMEDGQFIPTNQKTYGSILTVNAIDGTVIDKKLGY